MYFGPSLKYNLASSKIIQISSPWFLPFAYIFLRALIEYKLNPTHALCGMNMARRPQTPTLRKIDLSTCTKLRC
jgi:hypothetical protein